MAVVLLQPLYYTPLPTRILPAAVPQAQRLHFCPIDIPRNFLRARLLRLRLPSLLRENVKVVLSFASLCVLRKVSAFDKRVNVRRCRRNTERSPRKMRRKQTRPSDTTFYTKRNKHPPSTRNCKQCVWLRCEPFAVGRISKSSAAFAFQTQSTVHVICSSERIRFETNSDPPDRVHVEHSENTLRNSGNTSRNTEARAAFSALPWQ